MAQLTSVRNGGSAGVGTAAGCLSGASIVFAEDLVLPGVVAGFGAWASCGPPPAWSRR